MPRVHKLFFVWPQVWDIASFVVYLREPPHSSEIMHHRALQARQSKHDLCQAAC